MINIEAPNIDDVARVLVLESAGDGKYHCPRIERHRGDPRNGTLSIQDDSEFFCNCGLKGKGWIELVSKLYRVRKRKAKMWLNKRLSGGTIGISST